MSNLVRKPVFQLAMLVLAMFLAACGGAPAPAPTATPAPPPIVLSCGSAESRDIHNELGVSSVTVRPGGTAPLYSEPCQDQQKVLARVPGGTNLVPGEARALIIVINNIAQESGMFYKVTFAGKTGWLFSEQLYYELLTEQQPIPAPTMSPNGQATATAAAENHKPAGSQVPYYTSIGTPAVEALGGARYVYLYADHNFKSQVVALVPPKKGAIVLLIDDQGGELITKANAKYNSNTWFLVLINHVEGWVHASSLAIS